MKKMKLKQHFLSITLLTLLTLILSPTVHADAWNSIVHFAGGLAGDVVAGYFKPKIKYNDVDIIKKRMDILEHRYKNYDVSKGKPYNYKAVGDLILSLNNMTVAMTQRVGNLEGKVASLEQRIAKLEALQKSMVNQPVKAPSVSRVTVKEYYKPQQAFHKPKPIKVAKAVSKQKAVSTQKPERVINCDTTQVVKELMNCYSPIATKKDLKQDRELTEAYQALSK